MSAITRIDRLKGFLVTHRIFHRVLAEHLGVKRARATQIIGSDQVPQETLEKLRSFRSEDGVAIPEDLLPSSSQGRSMPPAPREREAATA